MSGSDDGKPLEITGIPGLNEVCTNIVLPLRLTASEMHCFLDMVSIQTFLYVPAGPLTHPFTDVFLKPAFQVPAQTTLRRLDEHLRPSRMASQNLRRSPLLRRDLLQGGEMGFGRPYAGTLKSVRTPHHLSVLKREYSMFTMQWENRHKLLKKSRLRLLRRSGFPTRRLGVNFVGIGILTCLLREYNQQIQENDCSQ